MTICLATEDLFVVILSGAGFLTASRSTTLGGKAAFLGFGSVATVVGAVLVGATVVFTSFTKGVPGLSFFETVDVEGVEGVAIVIFSLLRTFF